MAHFQEATCLIPAIPHGKEPEQVAQRRDEGSDVGERSGIQDFVYACDLSSRLNDSHLLQNNFGPARSIKLDGEGDQLEHQQNGITVNAECDQAGNVKQESSEDYERQHL